MIFYIKIKTTQLKRLCLNIPKSRAQRQLKIQLIIFNAGKKVQKEIIVFRERLTFSPRLRSHLCS